MIACDLFPKPKNNAVERLEQAMGRPLPEEMRAFYKKHDGISFNWQFIPSDRPWEVIRGDSRLYSLDFLQVGPKDTFRQKWSQKQKYESYLWFEGVTHEDQSRELEENYLIISCTIWSAYYVLLRLPKDGSAHELFLWNHGHKCKINLTITEFINHMLRFRGMWGWQEAFISPDCNFPTYGIPSHFLHNLQAHFPKIDVSDIVLPNPPPTYVPHSFELRAAEKNYNQRLLDLVDDLKLKLGEAGKVKFSMEPGVATDSIRSACVAMGRRLPDSLLAFYRSLNGFELSWQYLIPDFEEKGIDKHYKYATATFKVHKLEEVIGGLRFQRNHQWGDNAWKDLLEYPGMDPDDKEWRRGLKCILSSEYNDTWIRFEEGKEEPTIYVQDTNDFYTLTCTFEEYIETLFAVRGTAYWQRFLTDPDEYDKRMYNIIPPVRKHVASLWPEADLSTLRDPETE